jgi:glycosyltransferase involved in cell wall biosynthesis
VKVLGVAHAFGVMDSMARRLLLRVFRNRVLLIGVSRAVSSDILKRGPDLPVTTLHNCIDAERLQGQLVSAGEARQRLGLQPDDFVFANVGRLHADKDQATLIRAFSQISRDFPKAKLLLIGKGKKDVEYRSLVENLGLSGRVLMPGPVTDAFRYFRAFDVYVSGSDREPFGIVLTEAMLANIPVISTDCGGAPEVLGEHAFYFERGNDSALAQWMKELIQMDSGKRAEIGAKLATRLWENFSFEPFKNRLMDIVQDKKP